ncbi:LysR family transcriptional regulator [Rhizobium sp. S152]|uniref:LysR family transcriptional regulator n=1 Tax=Rhizobium sp. S152 TaxID=3055038 RepID=UPI0025A9B128|nr:LysR family transcriptional regulator [Rhizobium sp. S152]MDM9627874.1 LysR family transcriptional regulator [Rhizobium sp. S152]
MLSFMHVHIIALRYFTETVRKKSMRQAAEALNIAPSAVNRQILKLEEQLRCKLFNRLADGVQLTSAGEILYHYARNMERDLERAIGQIDDLRGLKLGHIRLAAEDGIAKDFLPSVLRDFHRKYDRVTISLEVTTGPEIIGRVESGEVDIGLAMGSGHQSTVLTSASIDVPLGIIMHTDHPLAGRSTLTEADLANELMIERSEIKDDVVGFHSRLKPSSVRRQFINTNASDVLTTLVKTGLGIGMRSPVGILSDLERKQLVFVKQMDLKRKASLNVYTNAQQTGDVSTSVILQYIRSALPEFEQRINHIVNSIQEAHEASAASHSSH